jgi:hypothetical protein
MCKFVMAPFEITKIEIHASGLGKGYPSFGIELATEQSAHMTIEFDWSYISLERRVGRLRETIECLVDQLNTIIPGRVKNR